MVRSNCLRRPADGGGTGTGLSAFEAGTFDARRSLGCGSISRVSATAQGTVALLTTSRIVIVASASTPAKNEIWARSRCSPPT
ncbi:MAG: hypothetical protein QM756_18870 [Polyangiaceae bacterium]